jgi:hypothetical protein
MVFIIYSWYISANNIERSNGKICTKEGQREVTEDNACALVRELDKTWGLGYSKKFSFEFVLYHGLILNNDKKKMLFALFKEMVRVQKRVFSNKFAKLLNILIKKKAIIDDRNFER